MKTNHSKNAAFFIAFGFLLVSGCFNLYSQVSDNSRLTELLSGYLENDLELQKKVLQCQSKKLSADSVKFDNSINLELSTGNVSVTTDLSDNRRITLNPSVKVSFPELNNGAVSFSLPYTIEKDAKTVSNGSASIQADLLGSKTSQSEISKMEADRSYQEAVQAVRDRGLSAEKEFYENLKKLYNMAIKIHSLKANYFDDSIDLKVLETQGYSKSSAKYRQASLKVESDRRQIQEQQRLFERETAIFAMKCGKEFVRSTEIHDKRKENGERDEGFDPVKAGETAYQEALSFLPDSIPSVKIVRIFDFDQDDYTQIESALWNQKIAELKRKADSDISLSALAEYKFNSSQSNYDDAGGKLNFDFKGITASAGFYVPTGFNVFETEKTSKNDNPYLQFGITVNPSEWKKASLKKQQNQLNEQLEEIAVKNARDAYEENVLSKVSSLHDIRWSKNSCAEELDMYTQLEADMKKWLAEGIVTESDYLDALNNKEKARLNVMINGIDLLIYNNEVKLLFHDR